MSIKKNFILKGVLIVALIAGVVLTFTATGIVKMNSSHTYWMTWDMSFQSGTTQPTINAFKQVCDGAIKDYVRATNAHLVPDLIWDESQTPHVSLHVDLYAADDGQGRIDSVVTPPCGPRPPPSRTADGRRVDINIICAALEFKVTQLAPDPLRKPNP